MYNKFFVNSIKNLAILWTQPPRIDFNYASPEHAPAARQTALLPAPARPGRLVAPKLWRFERRHPTQVLPPEVVVLRRSAYLQFCGMPLIVGSKRTDQLVPSIGCATIFRTSPAAIGLLMHTKEEKWGIRECILQRPPPSRVLILFFNLL